MSVSLPSLLRLRDDTRTILMVDGPGLYQISQALELELDYSRLINLIDQHSNMVSAYYFTPCREPDGTRDTLVPLLDYLELNGFTVVRSLYKKVIDTNTDRVRPYRSASHLMEIGLRALSLAMAGRMDHLVLVAGDGDLAPAIREVKHHGVRVTLLSTTFAGRTILSDSLRRASDTFVDLANIKDSFAKGGDSGDVSVSGSFRGGMEAERAV